MRDKERGKKKMDIREKLKEIIENMTEAEKISLWLEYCNSDNRMDDCIYSMEEFDEIFFRLFTLGNCQNVLLFR